MKLRLTVILFLLLALTGCAAENVKQALDNIHGDCTRHYAGSVGGVAGTSVTMTFDIQCKPATANPGPGLKPPDK